MKRTAAVIVTYNRKAMLQRCLRALCTQTAGVPELWVIDNASTDGTAELVAQLNLPTMHYYNTGKNLGGVDPNPEKRKDTYYPEPKISEEAQHEIKKIIWNERQKKAKSETDKKA